jgi:hypothetical protein
MAKQVRTEKTKLVTLLAVLVTAMILMLTSITVNAQCENDTINPWFVDFQFEMTMECNDFMNTSMPIIDDNCDEDVEITMLEDIIPGNCPGEQTIYRLYRVFDDFGNQVVESQIIHVVDETGPVITGDIYLSLECSTSIDSIFVTATDECSDVSITYSDVEVSGGNIIRIYTATDECNNASTFEQIIHVQQDIRVAICHRLGNGNWITIHVAQQAVPAHLAHGDYLGPCNEQAYPVLPMGIYLKEENGKYKKFVRSKE